MGMQHSAKVAVVSTAAADSKNGENDSGKRSEEKRPRAKEA